jgi:predicted DNA binding CopG/RHH family protein
MKPVQYFSDEYLQQCQRMTPDQIIRFLDDFRQLHGPGVRSRSKLISIKVPENLLSAFKACATLIGVPYQTQIKALMNAWVTGSDPKRPLRR